MLNLRNLTAGLAGAIALNLLHESLKRTGKDMPRIDKLGEQALVKTVRYAGSDLKDSEERYWYTLVADLASNSAYYAMIGKAAGNSAIWRRALALGLAAGIGALKLPEKLGLDDKPVAKTPKTGLLTIGYYLFGALVTGAVLNAWKPTNR